jgi:hypothetical protein
MQLGRHIRGLLARELARFDHLIPPSPIARRFLPCVLALGFAYIVINPPLAVNDERHHWLRALDLSKGRLVTRSDERGAYVKIPHYYYEELILPYARLPGRYEERIDGAKLLRELTTRHEMQRPGRPKWRRAEAFASGYSPIPYVPHLPALWFARLFALPALWQIYLSRISSLACYALLSAWGIAFAGELGWLLFVLALMPMSLTQAAALSGDGVTNGIAFLFFGLLAKGALRPAETLSRRELWGLALLGALLPLCKAPYLLACVTLLALRWEGAHAGLCRAGYAAAVTALGVACYAVWAHLNRGGPSAGPGTVAAQLAWLAADYSNGPRLAGLTLLTLVDDYLIELVAVRDVLHRRMHFLGGFVASAYLSLLAAVSWGACFPRRIPPSAARWSSVWLVSYALGASAAVFAAMFFMATQVEAPVISGVQGRYFIPVLPALLLTLSLYGRPSLSRWLRRRPALRLVTPIVLINALCLAGLIARYYGSASIEWPY